MVPVAQVVALAPSERRSASARDSFAGREPVNKKTATTLARPAVRSGSPDTFIPSSGSPPSRWFP